MNRREFLFGVLFNKPRPESLSVKVIEVFQSKDRPNGLLVHHADEATRPQFAQWLRGHNGFQIQCRDSDGRIFAGRLFRMKMCFGRGLILTSDRVNAHIGDVIRVN